jgi:hypothetical protein
VRLLIGAHLDTVPGSPGGNDNASGVAALLESARVLAAAPPEGLALVAFGAGRFVNRAIGVSLDDDVLDRISARFEGIKACLRERGLAAPQSHPDTTETSESANSSMIAVRNSSSHSTTSRWS